MKIMKICKVVDGLKPVLVMVVVQVAYAGVNILYKLAASDGMSLRIIIAYRFIFATAFMAPLALFLERKKRPKLTWTVLFQSFLCGLFGGSLSQNMYLKSLVLTSVTFTTAMSNLVPAVTFILAIIFRLESVGLRTQSGKAKVIGTLTGIGGAMLLTFYIGTELNIWKSHINLLKYFQSNGGETHHLASSSHSKYALGCLLAVTNCFSYASWLIIQAKMSIKYPCPYSSTALMCFMASIQATVFALGMERDWNQWKLGWNIRLLTVVYAGVLVAGIMVTLVIWCMRLRGPVFVSIFNPLLLVCTALAGFVLLEENLHLGSILGATLIVCGLYGVLWGKNEEMKKMGQLIPLKSTSEEGKTRKMIISSPQNDNCQSHSNVQT